MLEGMESSRLLTYLYKYQRENHDDQESAYITLVC